MQRGVEETSRIGFGRDVCEGLRDEIMRISVNDIDYEPAPEKTKGGAAVYSGLESMICIISDGWVVVGLVEFGQCR